MDSWSETDIKAMRVGGNQALLDFFARHNISKEASVSVKYKTETAALYREMYVCPYAIIYRIRAQVEGREIPEDRALSEDETNGNLVLQTFHSFLNYDIIEENLQNLLWNRISVYVPKLKSV